MGRDKAFLDWGGRPLALHVARNLATLFTDVFISGDPVRYRRLGLRCVPDAGGEGPLAGLWASLRAATGNAVFVVACDMPFVSPEAVKALWNRFAARDAAVPVTSSGLEPLHAFYSRRLMPAAGRALAGGAGLTALCEGAEVARVPLPEGSRSLLDCDTPSEYARASGLEPQAPALHSSRNLAIPRPLL